jgi:hypothetical protein
VKDYKQESGDTLIEIDFVPVSGDNWRPVLVFTRDAAGNPLDYSYFATGKQINILRNLSRLKRNDAKVQELAEDDLEAV